MMCPLLVSPSSVITDQIVKTIQMQIVPRLFILVPLVRILRSQLSVYIYQEKEIHINKMQLGVNKIFLPFT